MAWVALSIAIIALIIVPAFAGGGESIPTRFIKQHIVVQNLVLPHGQDPVISVLPLYKGYQWAITTRWDDPSEANRPMSALMSKYGIKGTTAAADKVMLVCQVDFTRERGRGRIYVTTTADLSPTPAPSAQE